MRLVKEFAKPCSIPIPPNCNLDAALIVRPKRLVARRTTVSSTQILKKSAKKSKPFAIAGRRRKSMCVDGTNSRSGDKIIVQRTIRPVGELLYNSNDIASSPPARAALEMVKHRGNSSVTNIPPGVDIRDSFNTEPVWPNSRPKKNPKRQIPDLLKIGDWRKVQPATMSVVPKTIANSFVTADFILQSLASYELLAKPPNDLSLCTDPIDRQSADFGKLYYSGDSE